VKPQGRSRPLPSRPHGQVLPRKAIHLPAFLPTPQGDIRRFFCAKLWRRRITMQRGSLAVSAGAKIPIVPVEFSPSLNVVNRGPLHTEEVPRLVKGRDVQELKELQRQGMSIQAISKLTGWDRKTIRKSCRRRGWHRSMAHGQHRRASSMRSSRI
jgi:hypothetical protein